MIFNERQEDHVLVFFILRGSSSQIINAEMKYTKGYSSESHWLIQKEKVRIDCEKGAQISILVNKTLT